MIILIIYAAIIAAVTALIGLGIQKFSARPLRPWVWFALGWVAAAVTIISPLVAFLYVLGAH